MKISAPASELSLFEIVILGTGKVVASLILVVTFFFVIFFNREKRF